MPEVVYGDLAETILKSGPRASARVVNHVLLGTWLEVVERSDAWLRVETAGRGPGGWVPESDVSTTPALKVFYVDVGQGDGAIVEAPNGRLLIDGGPSRGFYDFLRHLYGPTLVREGGVHFDAVVLSHPDSDHFRGLTRVLNDPDFTFGTIYHNGMLRYYADTPEGAEFDLGNIAVDSAGRTVLTDTGSTLQQIRNRIDTGSTMSQFRDFWQAALDAHGEGRLSSARRITRRDAALPGFDRSGDGLLKVTVLAPIPTKPSGQVRYVTLPDPHDFPSVSPSSSHTRNGHSVVLRLDFGAHSFLFGGDLNIPAQLHLLRELGDDGDLLRVDVAKACHHGSSDFLVEYLKKVRPRVNVFSSGDHKSFDHPMADALGAACRHTTGDHSLLFSTEIARAESSRGTHYGLVNARSNGRVLAMAQMKEQHKRADVWDSYTVPWAGRFPDFVAAASS